MDELIDEQTPSVLCPPACASPPLKCRRLGKKSAFFPLGRGLPALTMRSIHGMGEGLPVHRGSQGAPAWRGACNRIPAGPVVWLGCVLGG